MLNSKIAKILQYTFVLNCMQIRTNALQIGAKTASAGSSICHWLVTIQIDV